MLVPLIIVFIVGILIYIENIKAPYRYYAHNIGAMIPFIGGVLLLAGIGTILDESLNYKMATVLFDITFVYWPLMIIRCAILWIISKNSVWYIVKSYFHASHSGSNGSVLLLAAHFHAVRPIGGVPPFCSRQICPSFNSWLASRPGLAWIGAPS